MPSVPASSIHTSTLPAMNECWQEALHLAQREAHARGSSLILNTLPEGCFYYLEKGRLTILHGAADGSMKENSRPIRAASKLSTRSGRPVRRVPSASAATAVETERAMTLRAGIPQFMPAMTTAGRRARRKVMLLFQMVRPQCQNGGALTARSVCCMIFAPVWK